jgi:hypothetical protein
MWNVCLHLEMFCSKQVPRSGTLKSHYFRSFKMTNFEYEKNWNDRSVYLLVWFRMIAWSYCHSTKPWSYGMCSYCRTKKMA